jgi:hypothetical protein
MNTASNINTVAASHLSIMAFAGEEVDHAAMDEAEMFLGRAIQRGEWKNSGAGFESTIAGSMATEVSMSFLDKPLSDELTAEEKILLLDNASQIGREELTSCIIAMLPAELRMHASSAYDYTCSCS